MPTRSHRKSLCKTVIQRPLVSLEARRPLVVPSAKARKARHRRSSAVCRRKHSTPMTAPTTSAPPRHNGDVWPDVPGHSHPPQPCRRKHDLMAAPWAGQSCIELFAKQAMQCLDRSEHHGLFVHHVFYSGQACRGGCMGWMGMSLWGTSGPEWLRSQGAAWAATRSRLVARTHFRERIVNHVGVPFRGAIQARHCQKGVPE